jgi:DNA-binding CsgD family transcriptional regulator
VVSLHPLTKPDGWIPEPGEHYYWTQNELALLGTGPDGEVARRVGRSRSSVLRQRLKREVPAVYLFRPWTKEELALLGKVPDKEIARRLGRNYQVVLAKRKRLGIPNSAGVLRFWTKAEDRLLGTASDPEITRTLHRNATSDFNRRRRLGIAAGNMEQRRWMPREDRLLGRYSDEEIARRLNRTIIFARKRRLRLGIPQLNPPLHPWTNEEEGLLGTMRDDALANRLGRSKARIETRRRKLGLPVFQRLRKKWTPEEGESFRRFSNAEVARRLGVAVSAVQNHRIPPGNTGPPQARLIAAAEGSRFVRGGKNGLRRACTSESVGARTGLGQKMVTVQIDGWQKTKGFFITPPAPSVPQWDAFEHWRKLAAWRSRTLRCQHPPHGLTLCSVTTAFGSGDGWPVNATRLKLIFGVRLVAPSTRGLVTTKL